MLKHLVSTRAKGLKGEQVVSEFLSSKKNFLVLEKNFYSRYGEIDIICKDKNYLVFVEVRSFSQPLYNPIESITRRKIKNLKLAATLFLQQLRAGFVEEHGIEGIRFDFVGYNPLHNSFDHVPNVF